MRKGHQRDYPRERSEAPNVRLTIGYRALSRMIGDVSASAHAAATIAPASR